MLRREKNTKSRNNILTKCQIFFISMSAMICCTDKGLNDAHLNAYVYYISDTYHCPIRPEDKLSSREIELYFEVKNECRKTIFFPLLFGKDSTFYSAITLRAGNKRVYPRCLSIGYNNPLIFKDAEVFRACIHIDSNDLKQLDIDSDTTSLLSLLHQLDVSYYSSDSDQKHSNYKQCELLIFGFAPNVVVENGVLYRGHH